VEEAIRVTKGMEGASFMQTLPPPGAQVTTNWQLPDRYHYGPSAKTQSLTVICEAGSKFSRGGQGITMNRPESNVR
jgi:hypothetical protein